MSANFTSKTKWRAKLEKDQPTTLVRIPRAMAQRLGSGNLLIPRPIDVDRVIAKVGKGRLITPSQIRARLVADFNQLRRAVRLAAAAVGGAGRMPADCVATAACPLCTGIFIRIAAEAAEEDRLAGKKRITPYWRVVRDDGSLNEKFPGGIQAQARKLSAEGHRLTASQGKKPPRVADFEPRLARL